ncbi:Cytochrome b561 domain-containing protein, partial [Trichostrongylus colubriformis]
QAKVVIQITLLNHSFQFLFGFINFLLPGTSDNVRRQFLPFHQIVGSLSFGTSIVQATIGYVQYSSIITCPERNYSHDAPLVCEKFNFVFNFTIISTVLYGASVLLLVSLPTWKRHKTPEEMQ